MAKTKRETAQIERVDASVTPEQGVKLIIRQIEAGKAMLNARPIDATKYNTWKQLTREFLIKTFGSPSRNLEDFQNAGTAWSYPMNAGAAWWEQKNAELLSKQMATLENQVELLKTDMELSEYSSDISPGEVTTDRSKVFLVHGHDQGIRESVARFVERLGLQPIILHEMPNAGRTIIEKFTDHADVSFAIVLLTADDIGGNRSVPAEQHKPRARQNVILELGYFLGRLGRERVCALYQQGVEIPSDYSGVLFVPLDDHDGWQLKLARELKQAGFSIDTSSIV